MTGGGITKWRYWLLKSLNTPLKRGRPLKNDLTGQRFGRLVVSSFIGSLGEKKKSRYWLCTCDCGQQASVMGDLLRAGLTRSCGCLRTEIRRRAKSHGMYGTRLYNIWASMKQRCRNPKATNWVWYGGRGIKVCDRWNSFESFAADMGSPPTNDHSIDRIDNNGNYEPSNCKWSTQAQQAINRRGRKSANTAMCANPTIPTASSAAPSAVKRGGCASMPLGALPSIRILQRSHGDD